MGKPKAIRDNRGQTLIEVALVFPLLVLLLFGAVEYGRLCYVGIEATNAAHAGAVYGSQSRGYASDNDGITSAATNDGEDLQDMTVTPQTLCADTYDQTPVLCSSYPGPGAPPIEYIQVNTSVRVSSLFTSYTNGKTYTLTGQAIERVRQ